MKGNTMTDFKPGDIVHHPERGRGIVQDSGGLASPLWVEWAAEDDAITLDRVASNLRRLVVIDAEDREEVERFREIASRLADNVPYDDKPGDYTDAMQAALREFASPTPPKPDEPTGLGAVVEDAEGARYLRDYEGGARPWVRLRMGSNTNGLHVSRGSREGLAYASIPAVRVLSEGITP